MVAKAKERSKPVPKVDPLLTPAQVAEILGVSEDWLERDRATKRRIPFIHVSYNVIRYETSAVQRYIEQQRRGA